MRLYFFWGATCLAVCISFSLSAQHYIVNGGAKSYATADANTCNSDAYSTFNNIAGIAGQEQILLSASAKSYYRGVDISTQYFAAIYPLKNFSISTGFINHGNRYFNQQKVGIGVANKVGFMKLGLQINYFQSSAEGFGRAGTIILDFGGIAEISENLTFGAHIFNFTQSSLGIDNNEPIPIVMKAGLNYAPIPSFNTYVELEKTISSEPLFKVGLSYEPIQSFFIQTGVTINPTKNFLGLRYEGNKLNFGYAFSFHQMLGMIHQATLGLRLPKK